MFLHYQKLHLKSFEHVCEIYFGTVFCCLHVCVLHLTAEIIRICIAIFVQSFNHTVQFFIYKCLYAMPLFL
jgi:hypothetical protein